MEYNSIEYTKEIHEKHVKMRYTEQQKLKFLVNHGVLKGCIVNPQSILSSLIIIKNPINNNNMYYENLSHLSVVEGNVETYVPESVINYYKNNAKSQESTSDKFNGEVYVESLVAYVHHKKKSNEALRAGIVTHISKAGVLTVRDIVTGDEVRLADKYRHFVIDESLVERLMIIKLTKNNN